MGDAEEEGLLLHLKIEPNDYRQWIRYASFLGLHGRFDEMIEAGKHVLSAVSVAEEIHPDMAQAMSCTGAYIVGRGIMLKALHEATPFLEAGSKSLGGISELSRRTLESVRAALK